MLFALYYTFVDALDMSHMGCFGKLIPPKLTETDSKKLGTGPCFLGDGLFFNTKSNEFALQICFYPR